MRLAVSDLLQRVQARFLKELFRSSKGGFVLKGGMALATLFGPSRLTRDVDLDFPSLQKRTADSLHSQVKRALNQALRGTGIAESRISEPGKGEISPKWKVSGRGPTGEPFNMKLEVSRRPPPPGHMKQAPVCGLAAYGIGTYYVDLYDEGTLVAMKLAALLDRTATRDVCDLDQLLPAHVPGPALIADPALLERMDEAAWQSMRERVGKILADMLDRYALSADAS
jgi:predicted nucleotidyltransferase component of viral defense system